MIKIMTAALMRSSCMYVNAFQFSAGHRKVRLRVSVTSSLFPAADSHVKDSYSAST